MQGYDSISKLNEMYEDALFRIAMSEAAKDEGEIIKLENEQGKREMPGLPSSENIKRFSKLLDAEIKKKGKKLPFLSRNLHRASVVILFLVIAFSATMVTARAFRRQVLNFLISVEPQYTSFQLNDNSTEDADGKLIINWTNAYVPAYVPKGYGVDSISYSNAVKKIVFTNQTGDSAIIYSQYEASMDVLIDTENASLAETIEINGYEGILIVKDPVATIVLERENHIFTVQGEIERSEIIKMAEGIEFVK
ncbi:hypothetical protein HNQ56_002918 [Anaerotaenia torta]|uniref:DUF4367 domain-containing protein n=1 Tax=Anaerotaenia torta TaxID=433293 RepID=UPI003D1BDDD2